MISEMSLHAMPSNRKANTIVYSALIAAAMCVTTGFFVDRYRGIIGLLAMLFITVAVLFYTKYVSASYIYDVRADNDGLPLFIVRSRTGKRETTLARLNIERMTHEQIKSYRPSEGIVKYTYCPSFAPESVLLISVRSRYEKAGLIIEAPDAFGDYLISLAKEAREMYREDDVE